MAENVGGTLTRREQTTQDNKEQSEYSQTRLEAHGIIRVCTYPVVGLTEINMFRNLIDVSMRVGNIGKRTDHAEHN